MTSQDSSSVAVEQTEKKKKNRKKRVAGMAPWMVDMNQLAELTAFSTRTIKRMVAMDQIPGVIRFRDGGAVKRALRFDAAVVREWIAKGCPPQTGRR